MFYIYKFNLSIFIYCNKKKIEIYIKKIYKKQILPEQSNLSHMNFRKKKYVLIKTTKKKENTIVY